MTITAPDSVPTLSDQVAEEIRAMMARRRITGRQIAQKLGVSGAWVSYRLTGTQPIDLNDLQRIAGVLGVAVIDLLPNHEKPVRPGAPDQYRSTGGVTSADRRPRGYPAGRTRPSAPQRPALRSVA